MQSKMNQSSHETSLSSRLMQLSHCSFKSTTQASLETCCICFEPIKAAYLKSTCNCAYSQIYHPACIFKWFLKNCTCPFCRGPIKSIKIKSVRKRIVLGVSTLTKCKMLRGVSLVGNIKLNASALAGLSNLQNVDLPMSLHHIPNDTFKNCNSLLAVTIPHSVTTLGVCAFQNCTALTNIRLPASIVSVGEHAFDNCICLNEVNIFCNVTKTTFKNGAFSNCSALLRVLVPYKNLNEFAFPLHTELVLSPQLSNSNTANHSHLTRSGNGILGHGKYIESTDQESDSAELVEEPVVLHIDPRYIDVYDSDTDSATYHVVAELV